MKYKFTFLLSVLSIFLVGCDNNQSAENKQQSQKVVKRSLDNMVLVKGGEFLMGDFGPLVGEKIPFSINSDDKTLHKVILDDFMMSKYKVTNEDYNNYVKLAGGEKISISALYRQHSKLLDGNISVNIPWKMAKDYCLWLAKVSGKKIDLPTEAQWEFAARSRGKYLPYATNNGTIIRGLNIPTYEEIDIGSDGLSLPIYPIGKYPPNPLGLYDMGLSGAEWTNDWYSKDYYAHSPVKNPQGPDTGEKKVRRGNIGGDMQYALTMFRQSALPVPVSKGRTYEKNGIPPGYVFRCVVNN
ncbi:MULTISPECIES: SUMF1/EgtB/PvdO family nonheme iron enzyme [Rahnella]|uniref:SUMF1/EgtB/PvdO family nonheme iron enzyme n=1 Tax=Rahnella laticis TaxID=2787622 RepID=A0ABS0E2B5_9GAMM|nr:MULTISPECIES: SUMF1/EgtB/PvdO family nonheme iron enzyme [Rahnella]MBF7978981.1 SUMF1/EgtB/PvdO family nonheme iron enzyme [Rahnella laticis]MBF7999071.1 SUMF1/EgtB/PvdO family nonheme iron enzyme [Rahnella sp. LAC-M12]